MRTYNILEDMIKAKVGVLEEVSKWWKPSIYDSYFTSYEDPVEAKIILNETMKAKVLLDKNSLGCVYPIMTIPMIIDFIKSKTDYDVKSISTNVIKLENSTYYNNKKYVFDDNSPYLFNLWYILVDII